MGIGTHGTLSHEGRYPWPGVGQSDKVTCLRAIPMPSQDFIVYRVHKEGGVMGLTHILCTKNVTVREIIIKNHHEAKCNSVKLSVSIRDVAATVNDTRPLPVWCVCLFCLYEISNRGVDLCGVHTHLL